MVALNFSASGIAYFSTCMDAREKSSGTRMVLICSACLRSAVDGPFDLQLLVVGFFIRRFHFLELLQRLMILLSRDSYRM